MYWRQGAWNRLEMLMMMGLLSFLLVLIVLFGLAIGGIWAFHTRQKGMIMYRYRMMN